MFSVCKEILQANNLLWFTSYTVFHFSPFKIYKTSTLIMLSAHVSMNFNMFRENVKKGLQ